MAFVIGKIQTVKRRVTFTQLADDGQPAKKADFVVEMRVRDADTVKARRKELQEYLAATSRELAKASKDSDYEAQIPDGSFDEAYIHEDVVGIEGILDESGTELEFSAELLDSVLADRRARSALIQKWSELNLEEGNLKQKN